MSCVPPQIGPRVTGREGAVQNHFTSCLFLQRFVESEREFLNSLFLTNLSTFVLYGIPLLGSLLVASSVFYIPFFSRARSFYLRTRVPHLRCNCHHCSGSFLCSITGSLYTARGSSLAVNDRTWAFE